MTITAYLIDDEDHARTVLEDKLRTHCPDVEIIGSSKFPQQALLEVERLKPDILFLDIAMPGMSGFEFVEKLSAFNGEIIFVTAYNEYAVEAFKVCALGYLLKPVQNVELVNSIDSYKRRQGDRSSNDSDRIKELISNNKEDKVRLAIPTHSGYAFTQISDIIRCEGMEKYTNIYTKEKKHLSTKNIGYYVDILANYDFFPTHKSHLINMNFVSSYDRDGLVLLTTGDQIPISRRRKKEFLQQFA